MKRRGLGRLALAVAIVIALVLAGYWAFAVPHGSLVLDAAPPARVGLARIATGFEQPVFAVPWAGDNARLLVAEKAGAIWVVTSGQRAQRPYLDLRERVMTADLEQGLYTIALHPAFTANRRFFVAYTSKPDGNLVVAEYGADAKAATFVRNILDLPKPRGPDGVPFRVHNGGHLAFGPRDGFLYVSLGDGTYPRFTSVESQDRGTLWGSILRLDVDEAPPYRVPEDNPFVDEPGVRPEIWAYGLRNPWRFSFDDDGLSLWVSDVGQDRYEEIDRVTEGGNYGWPYREGRLWGWKTNLKALGIHRPDALPLLRGSMRPTWRYFALASRRLVPPVVDYRHLDQDREGGNAVVAGFVYHGANMPALDGWFMYGDTYSGRIWALAPGPPGSGRPRKAVLLASATMPTSLARGPTGEILLTDYASGSVYELVRDATESR